MPARACLAVFGGRGPVPCEARVEADWGGVVAGQGDGHVPRGPVRGPPVALGRDHFATGRRWARPVRNSPNPSANSFLATLAPVA